MSIKKYEKPKVKIIGDTKTIFKSEQVISMQNKSCWGDCDC